MTKDPRVYLAHIVECAARIRLYIASGEDAFQRDTMIQSAVNPSLKHDTLFPIAFPAPSLCDATPGSR